MQMEKNRVKNLCPLPCLFSLPAPALEIHHQLKVVFLTQPPNEMKLDGINLLKP